MDRAVDLAVQRTRRQLPQTASGSWNSDAESRQSMDDQRPARPRVRVTAQMRGAGAADLSNATGNRRSCPSFVNRRLLFPPIWAGRAPAPANCAWSMPGWALLSAEARGVR